MSSDGKLEPEAMPEPASQMPARAVTAFTVLERHTSSETSEEAWLKARAQGIDLERSPRPVIVSISPAELRSLDIHEMRVGNLHYLTYSKQIKQLTKARIEWKIRESAGASIVIPPGSRLLALAEFLCSPKTLQLFTQIVADLQLEYCQALSQRRTGKATWVRMRGYWSFWRTFVVLFPLSGLRLVVRLWKISSGV